MRWKLFLAVTFFTAAIACNNEATVQDETDSVIHTQDTNQSNWPEPGDILGNDTIPAPSQSKNPTLK